jgi:hypothetical protein
MSNRKYIIIAPEYDPKSAGVRVLYRLAADLARAGFSARCRFAVNDMLDDEKRNAIFIYPDTVSSNPYGARNVVRYLLMTAGFFGHDRDFPPSEYLYYYEKDFVLFGRDPDNILSVPLINPKRFEFKSPSRRQGSAYCAIKFQNKKGQKVFDIPDDCERITYDTDLVELFGRIETLYMFDRTAIELEAQLAGIRIVHRFNEFHTHPFKIGDDWDVTDPWKSYERVESAYRKQLNDFIARTQARFRD